MKGENEKNEEQESSFIDSKELHIGMKRGALIPQIELEISTNEIGGIRGDRFSDPQWA